MVVVVVLHPSLPGYGSRAVWTVLGLHDSEHSRQRDKDKEGGVTQSEEGGSE